MFGRRRAPRLRSSVPERRRLGRLDVGRECAVGADVDADDGAAPLRAHHVDRQVVHRAAVDEDLAALEHRRQHARDRDRGAQPPPQRPLLVHGDAPGREVRRHAEERQRQVLDVDVAELAAQQHADLAPGNQRHERQREVGQRVGVDEAALEALDEFLVGPVRGDARGQDGAHAGAADEVDRHAVLAQRAHDTEMREAARAAARQHEADRAAGQQPHQALEVGGRRAGGDAACRGERRASARAAPCVNSPSCIISSSARRMPPSCHLRRSIRRSLAGRARREQHDVGLPQAQAASMACRRDRPYTRRSRCAIRARGTTAGCGCPLAGRSTRSTRPKRASASTSRPACCGRSTAVVQRDQREACVASSAALARARDPSIRVTVSAREPQDRFRVPEQHALERRRGQHRQFRVAQRPHGRSRAARRRSGPSRRRFRRRRCARSVRRPARTRRGSR